VFLAPVLARAKREGRATYGLFAEDYINAFAAKWLAERKVPTEALGSADIQSLADLGNSYQVIDQMRIIPISRMTLIYMIVQIIWPIAPLILTIYSAREVMSRLVKLVF
jgi:hypothetical protein